MANNRLSLFILVLMGVGALAFVPGCVGDAGELDDAPDETSVESEVTGCFAAQARGAFANQTFSQQTGSFSAEVVATPSATPIDAVIGLSDGAASDYARLAAIVRFNSSGSIDVRYGGGYRADTAVRYVAGQPYRFRFDVNVSSRVYSVTLLQGSGSVRIATNYSFRSEQASVARLNNVASAVASSAGFAQVCGFSIAPRGLPCKTAGAGAGFTNTTVSRSAATLNLDVSAVPSGANVDQVVGVSLGAATSFSSLAAAMRFAPNGMIEARDGEVYRSNSTVTYAAGTSYQFHFSIDVARHEYSAWVKRPGDTYWINIGYRFRFRPTQSSVTALDNLATIVSSSTGTLRTCNALTRVSSRIAYAIDMVGERAALLPNDELLVRDHGRASTADTMLRLSATGQATNRLPIGGTAAVDGAGNYYVARAESPGLNLYSYSPHYVLRWNRTLTLPGDVRIHSIGVDSSGNVMVAMMRASAPFTVLSLHSFTSAGNHRWSINSLDAANIAFAKDGFVTAYPLDGWGVIRKQDSNSQLVWEHPYSYARPGYVTIDAMSVDDSGRVFLVGKYGQHTSFGSTSTDPLLAHQPGTYETNSYLVGLTSAGRYLFQRRLGMTNVASVSSNATRTVVSGSDAIGATYPRLLQVDSATGSVIGRVFDTSFGPRGNGGHVLISATGRVFWDLYTPWGVWKVAIQP